MREQILAMQPGRELDALVAEKVMGWTGVGPDVDAEIYGWPSGHNKELGVYWVPHYSTDISAAWEMMGKIGSVKVIQGEWYASVLGDRLFGVYAKSAPEAICKAALLAVMEE